MGVVKRSATSREIIAIALIFVGSIVSLTEIIGLFQGESNFETKLIYLIPSLIGLIVGLVLWFT